MLCNWRLVFNYIYESKGRFCIEHKADDIVSVKKRKSMTAYA